MKPLLFLMTKTLKNYMKELVRKPLALILYTVIAASVVMMLVLSFIVPDIRSSRGSAEVFGAVATAALLVFVYFGVKQGINNGSSFFRQADVNLVFTAPLSPKKVLLYGFIKQFFATFFIMLFLTFQIPNLKMNFPIKEHGVLIIYISVFTLFFSMQLIGMLVYSIASKSERLRKSFEKIMNGAVLLLVGGMLLSAMRTKDAVKAAVLLLNNDYIAYIPFIGWFKVILEGAVNGITTLFVINCILVALSISAMVFAVYRLKADYYEDVLGATEKKEELLRMKRAGKAGAGISQAKVRKVRHSYKGSGAAALFYRQLLEYKKGGFFFINRSTIIILAVGIGSKYFFPGATMKTVLFFSIYMLFFFTIQGKWMQELSKPFIYLMPSSSAAKVFYATLADIIKYSIDGLLLFVAAGLMYRADVAVIILSVAAYASYGAIYTYGDVAFQRVLGSVHSKNLGFFLKMLLILFVIAPGLVASLIIGFIFGNQYYPYIVILAYNIVASFGILLLSKGVFEHLEMG